MTFARPLRATHHCRHYSYETGLKGRGSMCALGVNLSDPGASRQCWPDTDVAEPCAKRADYTDAERAEWRAYLDASMERMRSAVQALPAPIPLRTSGKVKCPSCDGEIHYARWHRGAEIKCTTPNCCGPVHFSIEAGKDWPTPKEATS